MEKLSLSRVIEIFQDHNRINGNEYGVNQKVEPISAVIVYKESNWSKKYPEISRSYRINSASGKMFYDGMLGNSIYADCLDGTDQGVRLDWYRDWKVDYCYLEG